MHSPEEQSKKYDSMPLSSVFSDVFQAIEIRPRDLDQTGDKTSFTPLKSVCQPGDFDLHGCHVCQNLKKK